VWHRYELGATLGVGGYASVRLCTETSSGEIFAVKVFRKSFLNKRRYSTTSAAWKTNLDGVYREIGARLPTQHRTTAGGQLWVDSTTMGAQLSRC
jgi:serine/threonine protein kinase